MSQVAIAQFFVVAAIVLIVVHRWAANRWLNEYTGRYRRLPTTDWWRTVDRDPSVERWRRRRLAALVPAVGTFAIAMALLLTSR